MAVQKKPVATYEVADSLAQQIIIIDGHIDAPNRLMKRWVDLSTDTDRQFDAPKARHGGLDAAFMSIYTPASLENNGARRFAEERIKSVNLVIARHPEHFAAADRPEAIISNKQADVISLPLGMENGSPLEGDLQNLQHFYDQGIRYITLAHSKDNHICDSSYDKRRTWGGLSPFGYAVVAEMNRLGMMIDVSHISDSAYYQVIRNTKAPVIASHSSCRHFTPGFERNMSDEMLRMLANNGGLIMINFGSSFLNDNARRTWNALYDRGDALGISLEDEAGKALVDSAAAISDIFMTAATVADHIDHAVRVAGIDHVGLGSDFDGLGPRLPEGLKDASGYPNLILELLKRGYSTEDIEKICSGNLLRVWQQVAAHAAS
jgi:membrane dipeptidase